MRSCKSLHHLSIYHWIKNNNYHKSQLGNCTNWAENTIMLTWNVPSINLSIKYINTWIWELHSYRTHLLFKCKQSKRYVPHFKWLQYTLREKRYYTWLYKKVNSFKNGNSRWPFFACTWPYNVCMHSMPQIAVSWLSIRPQELYGVKQMITPSPFYPNRRSLSADWANVLPSCNNSFQSHNTLSKWLPVHFIW